MRVDDGGEPFDGRAEVLGTDVGVAMIGLYRPQLRELLQRRDAAVMDWRRRRRAKVHVFEDRRLETTSSLRIDQPPRHDRLRRLRSTGTT